MQGEKGLCIGDCVSSVRKLLKELGECLAVEQGHISVDRLLSLSARLRESQRGEKLILLHFVCLLSGLRPDPSDMSCVLSNI